MKIAIMVLSAVFIYFLLVCIVYNVGRRVFKMELDDKIFLASLFFPITIPLAILMYLAYVSIEIIETIILRIIRRRMKRQQKK